MEIATRRPLAIITGASCGIAYELTKLFAEHYYDLVIVSKNPAIVETAQICQRLGAKVECFIIDLSEQIGVDNLISKTAALQNPIEAIVINPGADIGDLTPMTSEYLAKHIVKEMISNQKGRILFMGNIPSKDLFNDLEESGVIVKFLTSKSSDNAKFGYSALMATKGFNTLMADYIVDTINFNSEDKESDSLDILSEAVRLKH
jgi:NADP-dependent 3-hydroxy acid dehydrogenase YdfG